MPIEKEFKINDFLSLKLEGGKTFIYVKGERFNQCKFLLLEFSVDQVRSIDNIESIDELAEKLDRSLEGKSRKIPLETEFWGHCSNLQAWYEHDYNTRLLHRNLAFPLLKKLTDCGDLLAKKVFKEEIAKRIESGYPPVVIYLIKERYLSYLNTEELSEYVCNIVEKIHILDEDVDEVEYYYDILDKIFDYHLKSQDLLVILCRFYKSEYFYLLEPYLDRLSIRDQIKLIDKTRDPNIFYEVIDIHRPKLNMDTDDVLDIVPDLIIRLDILPEDRREFVLEELIDIVIQIDWYIMDMDIHDEEYELFQGLIPEFLKGLDKLPDNSRKFESFTNLLNEIKLTETINKCYSLIEEKFTALINEIDKLQGNQKYSAFCSLIRAIKGTNLMGKKFPDLLDGLSKLTDDIGTEYKCPAFSYLLDAIIEIDTREGTNLMGKKFPDLVNGLDKLRDDDNFRDLVRVIYGTTLILSTLVRTINGTKILNKYYSLIKSKIVSILNWLDTFPIMMKTDSFLLFFDEIKGTEIMNNDDFYPLFTQKFLSLLNEHDKESENSKHHFFSELIKAIKGTKLENEGAFKKWKKKNM
ncbi:MAG: hypothetical protein ACFFAQ_11885 [Promethearchaeota archaeon]